MREDPEAKGSTDVGCSVCSGFLTHKNITSKVLKEGILQLRESVVSDLSDFAGRAMKNFMFFDGI